jgi:hypothetical protein
VGFVKIVKPASHPPCPVPHMTFSWKTGKPDFGVGTIWQCDDCGRTYRLVSIPARGTKGKWELVEAPS